jgi:hypothetical protein
LKKKAVIILAVALMLFSASARLNLVHSQNNSVMFDPVEKLVDPPMDGSDLTFIWPLNISTTYEVEAWEVILLWDRAVLRLDQITFGTFMTAPHDYYIANFTSYSSSGNLVRFAQLFTTQYWATGDGVLAWLKFTFVLPGFTTVHILSAQVVTSSVVFESENLETVNGQLKSDRPYSAFYWRTDDGINPVPAHTVYDAGRSLSAGTVVHFYGNLSYDVGNVYWTGSAWAQDGGYPDIVRYLWQWGDGTPDTDGAAYAVDHVFAAYKKEGYTVNLTVWDSEGDWWSSTWRYGGPEPSNTVPMWRDVAIVDIWPSLPPYYMWDEYGIDWGETWFFDSTDYWLPHTKDPYWNYKVDFPSYGYPPGETVQSAWQNYGSEGLYVLVTANNFGSVPEKVRINLYAQFVELNIKIAPPPPKAQQNINIQLIGTWTRTLQPNSGSGWNCYTVWMPPDNGTYLFVATIQAADNAAIHDEDYSSNYYLMAQPECNVAVWNNDTNQLMTDSIYVAYKCDVDGNGRVGPEDFAMMCPNFGKKVPT